MLTRGNLGGTRWGVACLCSTSHPWVAQLGQRNSPSRWTTHMAARLALAVGRELNQCYDSSHMSFSTGCLSFLLAWWLGSMSECPKRARARHFRDLLRSQMASFPPYSFSQGCHRVHSESSGGGHRPHYSMGVGSVSHGKKRNGSYHCNHVWKMPPAAGHILYDPLCMNVKKRQN